MDVHRDLKPVPAGYRQPDVTEATPIGRVAERGGLEGPGDPTAGLEGVAGVAGGVVVVGDHVEEGGAGGGGGRRERVVGVGVRGKGGNPREREWMGLGGAGGGVMIGREEERVGDEALLDHVGDFFVGLGGGVMVVVEVVGLGRHCWRFGGVGVSTLERERVGGNPRKARRGERGKDRRRGFGTIRAPALL